MAVLRIRELDLRYVQQDGKNAAKGKRISTQTWYTPAESERQVREWAQEQEQ